MKLKKIEKSKDKIKVEVEEETHTLLNLLRENAWKAGADQASYVIEHPYLSDPVLIVRSKNPQKTIGDAAQMAVEQAKEFQAEFKKALKR